MYLTRNANQNTHRAVAVLATLRTGVKAMTSVAIALLQK
jgi:hypothetical protein